MLLPNKPWFTFPKEYFTISVDTLFTSAEKFEIEMQHQQVEFEMIFFTSIDYDIGLSAESLYADAQQKIV